MKVQALSIFFVILLLVFCKVATARDQIHLKGERDWEYKFVAFQLSPFNNYDVSISQDGGARVFTLVDSFLSTRSVIYLPQKTQNSFPRFLLGERELEVRAWNKNELFGDVWLLPSSDPRHLVFFVTGEDKMLSKFAVEEEFEQLRETLKKNYEKQFIFGLFQRGLAHVDLQKCTCLGSELEPHLVEESALVFQRLRSSGKDPIVALCNPFSLESDRAQEWERLIEKDRGTPSFRRMMKNFVTFIEERKKE